MIRAAGTIVAVVCVALLSANTTTAHAAVANVAVPVPLCCPLDEIAAAGGLVALSSDESRGELIRIDPSTNAITATAEFPDYPPDGDVADVQNLVYAAGSVWFAAYFADVVYRVNPITLRVQDRIRIGRSPNGLVLADELLWTPLSNGRAVAAIDPVTAKVVRRVPVGDQNVATDGPLKPSWDGTSVLVALPGSGRVAHISPTTFGVTYDQVGPDVSCSNVVPVPGGYWLDDTDCGNSYFHWSAGAARITATISTGASYGAAYLHGALYTGNAVCGDQGCTRGLVIKYDARTGTKLAQRSVGIEAFLPHIALGSIWTVSFDTSSLQRSPLF